MPTASEIRSELQADPAGLGYSAHVAARQDSQLAAMLNAKAFRGPVPIRELSSYCIRTGVIGAVEAVAYEPTSETIPLALKALCHTVLTLIRDDYRLETVDVDDPGFGPACDGLVAAGLMTTQNKADIMALADGRSSRAEVLWGAGVGVSVDQVSDALNGA